MLSGEVQYIKFLLNKQYDSETVYDYMKIFKENLKSLKVVKDGKILSMDTVIRLKWSYL